MVSARSLGFCMHFFASYVKQLREISECHILKSGVTWFSLQVLDRFLNVENSANLYSSCTRADVIE